MGRVGLGWVGLDESPGGRGYRAPYGANKIQIAMLHFLVHPVIAG